MSYIYDLTHEQLEGLVNVLQSQNNELTRELEHLNEYVDFLQDKLREPK